MSDPSADRPDTPAPVAESPRFSPALGFVLALVIAAAIGFIIFQNNRAGIAGRDGYTRSLGVLGLGSPTVNRLDAAFTDADEDLVADPPADAAALRDPDTLRFSFLSADAAGVDPAQWRPLLDALAERTGKAVEYAEFPDADAQLRALRGGELDVTAFNTGGVPRAVNAAGFVPVAGPAIAGKPASYRTLILARKDSGITRVGDLAGRLVAFTRVGSNSGFKAPLVVLYRDYDLQPGRDFDLAFAGSHSRAVAGLADGNYDVAAVASDLYEGKVAEGVIDPDAVVEVYRSPEFPRAAFGYAHDLEPGLAAAVAETLLSFRVPGTAVEDAFAGQGVEGFAPLDYREAFALVRLIDDTVGFEHNLDAAEAPDGEAGVLSEPAPASAY